MINDLTPSLNLPLPHPQNNLEDDVTRLRESLIMLDTVVAAKADDSDVADAITGKADKIITIANKTASYTVVAGDLNSIINCTSGTFTVGLTKAATLGTGFSCWVWNTSTLATDVITVDPYGSEFVDGLTSLSLRRGEGLQVICDGVSWQTGSKKAWVGYAENIPRNTPRPVASGEYSQAMGTQAVASASFSTAIGYGSTASGSFSLAIGNRGSSAQASYSTAIGGGSAAAGGAVTAIGVGAMALGGSYASGVDSFAAAIGNNTSSYGALGANSIAIGDRALASGPNSCAVGGRLNIASGTYSTALGGFGNTASGQFSLALGGYCVAAQFGKQAFASGQFASAGDAQSGKMVLRGQTTDATIRTLTSDGGGNTSTLTNATLPDDSTFIFKGQVVARNTAADADSKCWEIKGAVRRGAGANTIALIGTPVIDVIASDGSPWTLAISLSPTAGVVLIRATGEAAKTINWVCTLDTTEVTG